MTQSHRQLWQWLFEFNRPSKAIPFNPASADAVIKQHSTLTLFYTAVRRRGLWHRRNHGKQGNAMSAVMELSDL